MLFIWLKREAVAAVEGFIRDEGLKRIKVDCDEATGRKRIVFNGDVFDPTVVVPAIPPEFVEEVTLKEDIYDGFCPEGIYRLKGATMLMRIDVVFGGARGEDVRYQSISISAPSMKVCKEIYTLVRQKKHPAEENWNPPDTPSAPLAGAPAGETKGKTE